MSDENQRRLTAGAVLLDLDGTLVDSHDVVERCWRHWADEVGVPVESFLDRVHGRPGVEVMAEVLPDRPAEHNLADSRRMLGWELDETAGVYAYPGAAELLAALAGWPHAIVTACPEPLARARMDAAGLPLPPAWVTGDQLDAGKPDPQGYLRAARMVGVEAHRCVAVEDAPAGVRAAFAAGMGVIGIGEHAASAEPSVVLRGVEELEVAADATVVTLVAGPPSRPDPA